MNAITAVVIENDTDLKLLITDALEDGGFTVHTTGTGPDAVRTVQDLRPDLVTMDMNLPGMDAFAAIRRIRTYSSAPIMIISAGDDIRDIEAGLDAGADDYVAKPFRPKTLQARAHALLRRPA
jgi:DNA-binding response OmpR family regulator